MRANSILQTLEKKLPLSSVEFFQETHTSFLYKTKYKEQDSLLKIFKEDSDEKDNPFLFKHFNKEIRPEIFFVNNEAILLEMLYPGDDLSKLDKNDPKKALEILCSLVRNLKPTHHAIKNVKDISQFIKNFDTAANHQRDGSFNEHLKYAKSLYQHLIESQSNKFLLHGDLHHYNILKSGDHWKIIDPKGCLGEIEYEISAFIKNPVDYPDIFSQEDSIKMRAEYISKELDLSAQRIINWAYVNTVLSITYLNKNDKKKETWMKLVKTLRKML